VVEDVEIVQLTPIGLKLSARNLLQGYCVSPMLVKQDRKLQIVLTFDQLRSTFSINICTGRISNYCVI